MAFIQTQSIQPNRRITPMRCCGNVSRHKSTCETNCAFGAALTALETCFDVLSVRQCVDLTDDEKLNIGRLIEQCRMFVELKDEMFVSGVILSSQIGESL